MFAANKLMLENGDLNSDFVEHFQRTDYSFEHSTSWSRCKLKVEVTGPDNGEGDFYGHLHEYDNDYEKHTTFAYIVRSLETGRKDEKFKYGDPYAEPHLSPYQYLLWRKQHLHFNTARYSSTFSQHYHSTAENQLRTMGS
jgi:hypothetical protein